LHHPNIAQLFDGGTENKTPYLVMEYVQGSRITKYVEERRLSVEDRVRLFLPVCSAVEYAHRAFIVHRDLKPGNILVDATGTPKLLDFGLSKLLHSELPDPADPQEMAMATPDYASPEQIMGNPVTAASDIYSLGAVLYELLSGARPHRIEHAGPAALEQAICVEPTVPPSAALGIIPPLARRLAGDLDSIVLRAMQKDPERRYASADHLADDLRRHLEHWPVTARRDSRGYRLGKFVRRNSLPVVLAAAAAAVAGIGGVAVYGTRAARKRARQAALSGRELERELAAAHRLLNDAQALAPPGVRVCAEIAEIAKALWEANPSDAHALRNYGAAQLRLGMAIPDERVAEKRAALELSRDWLRATLRENGTDTELRRQLEVASATLAELPEGDRP
jgi:serine/threonine-protein kinase